jgi:signal transduction histidine kinase
MRPSIHFGQNFHRYRGRDSIRPCNETRRDAATARLLSWFSRQTYGASPAMSSKYSEATISTQFLPSKMRFRIYSWWPKIVAVLLVTQAALAFIFGNGTALNGYYEFNYLGLLVLASGLSVLNALRSQQAIRLFWSFLAVAMGLWALLPIFALYQLLLHQWANPLLDMTPGFLHIVLIIAAVAARPHLKLPTEKPYRATLSFLILIFFAIFTYVYVLAPYAYDQHQSAMILRYEILYFTANCLLLSLLAFGVFRSQSPWKSIYEHLLGASTVYALGSLMANLAWASGHNHFGGLTGLPFTASISWFVWIALLGQETAVDLERSARRDALDTRRVSALAMIAVLAIPLIGLLDLFRPGELDQTRVVRLVLVQVAIVMLGLVIFSRAILANRDLASSIVLANDRLRLAVEAGKMYAYEWNVASDKIVRSAQCGRILDWMEQPTTDTRESMLANLYPQDRQLFEAAVAILNPSNPNFQISYRILSPCGSVIWLEDTGHALFDDRGKMLGTLGMIRDVTERKRMEEALEKVSGQLIAAQEKERSRLARELHDDICQRLAMLSTKIEKAGNRWGRGQSSVADQLKQIWRECSNLAGDVQALSHELHPSILDNLGLATALKCFCRDVSEQHGVLVEFASRNIPNFLPSEISLSLYRVVQEAIHNAIKYSGQKHFGVNLQANDSEMELEVSDQGVGFDAASAKNGGLGLVSMAERIHQVHGTFSIDSQPNVGTRIRARVPLTSRSKAMTPAAN